MSSLSPIRSVRDQITDQLRNEILAHQHAPDQPMREQELAERFGTSRGPVRDVLLQLTKEGVLVYRPNAGVRVSTPPDKATRDVLMKLRKEIELHALPSFLKRLDANDEQMLAEILHSMERACIRKDLPGIVGSDVALHRYIVKRGAASELEEVWLNIAVRILMAYSRLPDPMDIYREHARIVAAIISRNLKASRTALTQNLI